MAERKGAPANKIAMSRALGAAFLSHQVEQLEKSVNNGGPASGNWRDRRLAQTQAQGPPSSPKRGSNNNATNGRGGKKGGEIQIATAPRDIPRRTPADTPTRRRSTDDKDADVIVVDASLLIHGLDYIKKWVKNGREEIVIVPLEALNTLDLLKKGTTPLAQKARAASRILEAQVGTNPRIRVQRDDAFVLWDKITFGDSSDAAPATAPEWLRRTICCAKWEADNANTNIAKSTDPTTSPITSVPPVVLAICNTATLSPAFSTLKLSESPSTVQALTPVPLPLSSQNRDNKHEPRSSGTLVAQWANRARIKILDVPVMAGDRYGRSSSEEERPNSNGQAKRSGKPKPRRPGPGEGKGQGLVERSPAVLAMMEMVSQPSKVVRVLARGEKLDPDP